MFVDRLLLKRDKKITKTMGRRMGKGMSWGMTNKKAAGFQRPL
jgi:hypothetical protein